MCDNSRQLVIKGFAPYRKPIRLDRCQGNQQPFEVRRKAHEGLSFVTY